MGKFRISQEYSNKHTGLDLVGVDSKEIHSTVNGVVDYAGWENAGNHKQGFGQYVRIKDNTTGHEYYFGHLSEIKVKVGQAVKITDVIGIEGSTGYSTGSHCHYEIRRKPGVAYRGTVNVSEVSGIPNNVGGTYDDGYRTNKNNETTNNQPQKETKVITNCSMLNLRGNASYGNNVYKAVKAGTKVEYLGIENGWAKISYEGRTLYCGKNYLK
ncbi:MAG: peptidoglycan DD-metalloendopeptidase family protein [Clostridia bacterium]|jgi:murein DD-endopeptidase MepM/ murein hydrolase activator NlpD|nr:peptidoglycan DD-metalloendopeptidase family protein [Clostridia bacterium]